MTSIRTYSATSAPSCISMPTPVSTRSFVACSRSGRLGQLFATTPGRKQPLPYGISMPRSCGSVPRRRCCQRRGGRRDNGDGPTQRARAQSPGLPVRGQPLTERRGRHAIRTGDLFDDAPGLAAHWRPTTVRMVQRSYGQWLGFLLTVGRLGGHSGPAGRIVPEALRAYIKMLRPGCRGTTVLIRVQLLFGAARVMFPDQDWQWLRRVVIRLRAGATDRKPKLHRIRSSRELSRLGFEVMAEAEAIAAKCSLPAAIRFRDGLIIALLAARPIRAASFCSLRLGSNFVRRGDCWWLSLAEFETKTATSFEAPLSHELVSAVERYLELYRPRLLCGHENDHLWLTKQGKPMSPQTVRTRVMRLTAARFGVGTTTHLFRDCLATSVAIEDPEHVRIAAAILGHRSLETTTRYYNQARSLEAGRAYQATILKLRRRLRTAIQRKP